MPNSLIRFASVAIALLAVPITGTSQGLVPRAQPVIPATPGYPSGSVMLQERMPMIDPDKKLGAGDQVTVEIVEDREGGLPRVVTATGELDVPPLGRVKVAGKTVAEAAGDIKQLLERDYYYHATVRLAIDRVNTMQVRSGIVYLSGEVKIVGPQEIVSGERLTLSNALLRANGLTEWGNAKKVKLMRQLNGATQTIEVNYQSIIESGDVKSDPMLQDGDRIFVPKRIFRY